MPYKSEAQRRYFNANRAQLEAQGVDVDEWNAASKTTAKKKTEKSAGGPQTSLVLNSGIKNPHGAAMDIATLAKMAADTHGLSLAEGGLLGAGLGTAAGYLKHRVGEYLSPSEDDDARRSSRNRNLLGGALAGGGAGALLTQNNRNHSETVEKNRHTRESQAKVRRSAEAAEFATRERRYKAEFEANENYRRVLERGGYGAGKSQTQPQAKSTDEALKPGQTKQDFPQLFYKDGPAYRIPKNQKPEAIDLQSELASWDNPSWNANVDHQGRLARKFKESVNSLLKPYEQGGNNSKLYDLLYSAADSDAFRRASGERNNYENYMKAGSLAKMAADKAESIVNTNSTGGRLADYLAPVTWGGERAGRTQAMADAIDEDTTFNVRHPATSALRDTVLSGLAGAGLGGGIGMGIDRLNSNSSGRSTLSGALTGGAVGALNGLLASGADRREEMRRINHFYEEDRKANRLKDVKPQFSAASMLLAPGRGAHRTGQLEAKRAIGGEKSISDQHGGLRDLLYALRLAPGGGSLGLAHAYGQNARTQLASSGASDSPEVKEPKRRPKAVEKEARCWEGYEPVPGKAPYSNDSCRPKGSAKKKTDEKKADSCGCGSDTEEECGCSPVEKLAYMAAKHASGAWTRDEGQSESGGLNAKGRASLKAQGQDIKPPVTESNPKGEAAGRKASFCARMGGMKSKLTSSETANDPDSRINKALRKWNC